VDRRILHHAEALSNALADAGANLLLVFVRHDEHLDVLARLLRALDNAAELCAGGSPRQNDRDE
jgi:hypothetical protein